MSTYVDNIVTARLGLIHTNILTNEEIIDYKFDVHRLQNIKLGIVLDNNENIIFAIKVPKNILTLEISLLYPITDNTKNELLFDPQKIIKYNNKIYNYVKGTDFKNLKISSNCMLKIRCLKVFNNASEIIELSRGLILLKNQNNVNISSNCDDIKLIINGNYLINFNNCSIKINNRTFENNRKEITQSFILRNFIDKINDLNKNLKFDDIVLEQKQNKNEIIEIKYEKKNKIYIWKLNNFNSNNYYNSYFNTNLQTKAIKG